MFWKKFFNMNTPRRYRKTRGQVMILYALCIPLLLLFVGVGLDLGWYYLNVSKLQNAADAAVLAGAQAFVKDYNENHTGEESFYTFSGAIVDKYFDNKVEDIDTTAGDEAAKTYAAKNLGKEENEKIFDTWSRDSSSEVTITPELHQADEETFYYAVHLTEKIQHLFMPGWFKAMDAPVVAVALISKNKKV